MLVGKLGSKHHVDKKRPDRLVEAGSDVNTALKVDLSMFHRRDYLHNYNLGYCF